MDCATNQSADRYSTECTDVYKRGCCLRFYVTCKLTRGRSNEGAFVMIFSFTCVMLLSSLPDIHITLA